MRQTTTTNQDKAKWKGNSNSLRANEEIMSQVQIGMRRWRADNRRNMIKISF
jgi:hypothetical protein